MCFMFTGATSFNQPLKSWNTNKVTDMNFMFSYAKSFNQNLKSWNITKSAKRESVLFGNNSSLGKSNLPTGIIINNKIITPNAPNYIRQIITKSRQFNDTIKSWNTNQVTNMSSMFDGTSFNQPLNSWNTNKVTSMYSMFTGTSFNQPLNSWNTNKVTNMDAR